MSNHSIPLTDAVTLTTEFRSKKETILGTQYRNKGTLPICETFDRDAFDELLAQDGCVSIRIYFSMDSVTKVKLIAVGVNDKGEDILPDPNFPDPAVGKLMENGTRCPAVCPPSSVLNS